MIKITLKGGDAKEFEQGVSLLISQRISARVWQEFVLRQKWMARL